MPFFDHSQLVDSLNERFADATSQSIYGLTAGVAMRAYDVKVDPWGLMPPTDVMWVFRNDTQGVVSASYVHRSVPFVFLGNKNRLRSNPSMGHVGVVLSPAAVRASLLCSYASDAGSIDRKCSSTND